MHLCSVQGFDLLSSYGMVFVGYKEKEYIEILLNLSGFQLGSDYPESLLLRQNNTSKTDPRHRCVTHNLPGDKILTDTF